MIELECLSASWGMKKCQHFFKGLLSFKLATDHTPLIPILNDYALDKLGYPRHLRLRLKIQRYVFTARWIPGKTNLGANALSRTHIDQPQGGDELAEGVKNTG